MAHHQNRAVAHGLLLAGIAIAVIVVGVTTYFVWSSHRESRSALWVKVDDVQRKLDEATDTDEVKKALDDAKSSAEKNAGTPAARALRFERARTLMRQGLGGLASENERKRSEAIDALKEARKIYSDLASDSSGKDSDPLLTQEALMRVAIADESVGELDEALKGYKKVTENNRDSFIGKAAQAHINVLEGSDSRKDVTEVAEKLGFAPTTNNLPPLDNTK